MQHIRFSFYCSKYIAEQNPIGREILRQDGFWVVVDMVMLITGRFKVIFEQVRHTDVITR